MRQFFTLDATRWQYLTGVARRDAGRPRILVPRLRTDIPARQRPGAVETAARLRHQRAAVPTVHEYFRASHVPLLAVWGRGDEIFGPAGAEAFADDLPDAEIHLLDGGHFLLESALDEVTELIRNFLAKQLPCPPNRGPRDDAARRAMGWISHNWRRPRVSLTRWPIPMFTTNNG